jgi:hypothetical protein
MTNTIQTLQLHSCPGLIQHNNTSFNMEIEIQENQDNIHGGELIVFDFFTRKATPPEYIREHEYSYSIDIKVCPFCAEVLKKN